MKTSPKKNFPPAKVRRFLESGPIVLVSSAHQGERNIMTLGWHMVLEFEPSLVGCYIWDENRSFSLIRRSRECVINVPKYDMIDAIIGIGNRHGPEVDKFQKFQLTPAAGKKVSAPSITECFANFECKLVDTSLIKKYSLFVFEVVHAQVATRPRYPKTVHYRGDGVFMVSGSNVNYRGKFRKENL